MGPGGAKLVEFVQLRHSFRQQASTIREMEGLHLWGLTPQQVAEVASVLWSILSRLVVGTGRTKIVAGSKAL